MTLNPDSQPQAGTPPIDTPASHQAAPIPGTIAEGPFGRMLEPVLRGVCEDRLSEVSWFRTDWQRGGAATGYATYLDDDGTEQPVVVKLPVPPCELLWMRALLDAPDVVPKLYAGDEKGFTASDVEYKRHMGRGFCRTMADHESRSDDNEIVTTPPKSISRSVDLNSSTKP